MANRNFNRSQNLEKEVKSLFAQVSIGAAGAPTIVKALGITSITRNSAGNYTLKLDDTYTRLMFFRSETQNSTVTAAGSQLGVYDVTSAKTIQFFTVSAGVATDPVSGSSLFIKIDLKNSSAGE